jgi:response regulator RpfG family c-di-GMP phosphodiesterase
MLHWSRPTVLMVGIRRDARALMRRVLMARGIDVVTARDGIEAITASMGKSIGGAVLEFRTAYLSPAEILAALEVREARPSAVWYVNSRTQHSRAVNLGNATLNAVHPLELCDRVITELNGASADVEAGGSIPAGDSRIVSFNTDSSHERSPHAAERVWGLSDIKQLARLCP